MNESGISAKITEARAALTRCVGVLKSINFASEWSGASCDTMTKDLNGVITDIERLLANLGYETSTLNAVALCKNEDATLQTLKNRINEYIALSNTRQLNTVETQNYQQAVYSYETHQNTKKQYLKVASTSLGQISSAKSSSTPKLRTFTKTFNYSDIINDIADTYKAYGIGATGYSSGSSSSSSSSSYYSGVTQGAGLGVATLGSYYSEYEAIPDTDSKKTDSTDSTMETVKDNGKTSVAKISGNNYVTAGNYTTVGGSGTVENFANYTYNNGICQHPKTSKKCIYGDKCLSFAYAHAYGINKGTKPNVTSAANYTYAGHFKEYSSTNKQDVLNKVYSEVSAGRPVVLQVNGNTSGTSRHYVTVVGFKSNVTSASKLTEDDLLIIDSYDGRLESMDKSTSRFMTTGKACGKNYAGYQIYMLK